MRKKIIAFFILAIPLTSAIAQHTLTAQHNSYRAGDQIVKQQVEFIDPGASGKNITWDFSHLNMIDEKYQLIYFSKTNSDTTQIVGLEHDTRYYYTLNMDTLWLTGYENRTTKINYQQQEVLLRYPFQYGDTLGAAFAGTGLYCQKVDLFAEGYTKVIADATGKLVTPENDTLKNVIRLLRVKEFRNIGLDSTTMRMETYQWYAAGSRYPVFETIKALSVKMDSTVDEFSTSFYFSTINREQLQEDLANTNLFDNGIDPENILINCYIWPNPVVTYVTVNYELSMNAQVSFLLCDLSGRPWLNIPSKNLIAGNQQQKINMNGLHKGDYGLYIKVNDKIYRRTIIKI